ncbi:MAG: hypothetical protein ACK4KT_04635 [Thermaurantimonas sp.]
MLGISKYFEKKSASKSIVLTVFQVALVAALLLLQQFQLIENSFSFYPFMVFVVLNVGLVYLSDFYLTKIGIIRDTFYYLPLLFTVNTLLYFKNLSLDFIINQIVFVTILFIIVIRQNQELIQMHVFHISFLIVAISFFFYQVIFVILPVIILILIFSTRPIRNISVYFISIGMSFFFLYSLLYFFWKIFDYKLMTLLSERFSGISVQPGFEWYIALMLLFFIVSIFEVINALNKANIFRKNFMYMSVILIAIDIGISIFLSGYVLSYSIPLICYLYGNFIRFRKKAFVKEIFFSGAIVLCILLMYLNV